MIDKIYHVNIFYVANKSIIQTKNKVIQTHTCSRRQFFGACHQFLVRAARIPGTVDAGVT